MVNINTKETFIPLTSLCHSSSDANCKMDGYRRSQFIISPPAILKAGEMLILVTGMILFLVENSCPGDGAFLAMYLLPCGVCLAATLVSYVTAVLVLVGGRNPLTTPAWVKGDVWFNVCALVLMLVGSVLTLTRNECANNYSMVIAAIALGFISVILYASSGAVTYVILTRHREEVKAAQRAQLEDRRVTLSALA